MAISTRLQIGDQFDHFQIRYHIARGGMSDIYTAYDLLSRKDVVLKIPDRMSIGDPAQYERFQRELEVMRTLNHPAIQKGLASGVYNNTPYLVTELIDGTSLRNLIGKNDPLKVEDVIILMHKIAEGLLHCHEHGIIHRDLKPENILINFEGQPIILDFGLALTKNAHRVTYANLSGAAGTPDFMAPEQIEGHRGDNRTDIYALGIIFFELLTGEAPFRGDNHLAVMAQHLKGAIPRLDKLVEGVSPQIAAIIAKCLQRNPDERYKNLREFIDDLDKPENVDITILNKLTGKTLAISRWRSPIVVSIGTALLMLIIMIIIALILQHIHK